VGYVFACKWRDLQDEELHLIGQNASGTVTSEHPNLGRGIKHHRHLRDCLVALSQYEENVTIGQQLR
jgi:hypothetical protein